DVVQLMLEERAYGKDLDDLRAKLGLDRPIYVQYFEWAGRVVRGELGESLWTKRPVLEELGRRLPVSLELGLLALLFSMSIALPIGILAAVRQDSLADYVARTLAIVGLSVPGFWIATLVIFLPSIWWNWSPPIQFTEFGVDPWAHVAQFIIPAFILGIASSAAIMRLTRAQLLEVLRQDYVRTAWAKGVRERVVVLKHSLKNSLIPVINAGLLWSTREFDAREQRTRMCNQRSPRPGPRAKTRARLVLDGASLRRGSPFLGKVGHKEARIACPAIQPRLRL